MPSRSGGHCWKCASGAPPLPSGDTTPCAKSGDTTRCRMTRVTLHGVVSPDPRWSVRIASWCVVLCIIPDIASRNSVGQMGNLLLDSRHRSEKVLEP